VSRETRLCGASGTEPRPARLCVALLTGGWDKHYTFGLATALAAQEVDLDVAGGDDVDCPEMHSTPGLNFLNLRGSKKKTNLAGKIKRVSIYYARLFHYAAVAKPPIFHVLWNSKFVVVDRIILMLYYKFLGKKVVFTAHNINAAERDHNDSFLNRLTLKAQYRLADHIFVHTEKMKRQLHEDFGVRDEAVTVIPFGINNAIPQSGLTTAAAKRQLGIGREQKTILFFGGIRPYKGLEYLVEAFLQLAFNDPEYRLIIAGFIKEGYEGYMEAIQKSIGRSGASQQIIKRLEFIPDEDSELYFKAADVVALPYTHIFQSGLLFLAYNFGLPVIAADVGSLREDIVEGKTGFVCKPRDAEDLARTIQKYFASDLFRSLDLQRPRIRDYANARHSWNVVATMTRKVYADLA